MNTLSSLVNQSLKAYKTKNRLVVLTIVMTTCLLTAIGILSYSLEGMLLDDIIRQTGSYHGVYTHLDEDQLRILQSHRRLEKVGEAISFGSAQTGSDESVRMDLLYIDDAGAEMTNIQLVQGSLPRADNEIAMEGWLLEDLGLKPEPGQRVKIGYSTQGEMSSGEEEQFIVSGVLKDNERGKAISSTTGLLSKGFVMDRLESDVLSRASYVRLKNTKDISQSLQEIGDNAGVDKENIHMNREYVKALGGDFMTVLPFLIIGFVVAAAAAIVIFNVFYISIVERIQQFGLLSALGATKKQIRKIIFREGFILSLIGIPLGIGAGYILSYLVIPALNFNGNLQIRSSLLIPSISIFVSLITVQVSLRKPGRIASRISPLEAIQFNGAQTGMKKASRKGERISLYKMAYLNLWRNKKRTVMTMLSLTMSGVLFIVFSTILFSMNPDNLTRQYVRSDIQLTSTHTQRDDGSDPLNEDLLERIRSLEGVKGLEVLKYTTVQVPNNGSAMKLPDGTLYQGDLNSSLYGLNESMLQELKQHAAAGSVSIEDLKSKNQVLVVAKGEGKEAYKVGDQIKLIKRMPGSDTPQEYTVEVAGIVTENIGWLGWEWMGPPLILHQETFTRILGDERIARVYLDVEESKYQHVEDAVKHMTGSDRHIECMSYKSYRSERIKELNGMKTASLSLVVIIGLIGIINLINTMVTSILTRKQEIGMLEAVGLSNRQLRRMLQLEGLYYALSSAVISTVGGTWLGRLVYNLFKRNATYAEYRFPWMPILLTIVIFMTTQVLITHLIGNRLKKYSIIDKIRYNE